MIEMLLPLGVEGGRGSFLAPSEAGNSSRALGLLRSAAKGVK
jgi:hypothetical protein